MKTYAYVVDGIVYEIIPSVTWPQDVTDPESGNILHKLGEEISITDRYTPEFVAQCFEIPSAQVDAVIGGWTYDGAAFAAPVPYLPSPEEIKTSNISTRDALLEQATAAIAPLQDAVDLDMATDADTASLKAWKTYRVTVIRVDLTLASPNWPTPPSQ